MAFPGARSKLIPRGAQNVNCLPLECLAFTIREYQALLKGTQSVCIAELHSIISPICFSFPFSIFCLLWIICWFTMREGERVLDNQQWLWLAFRWKETQSALSDGLLSISFSEWANEEAQQRDLKGVKWKWSGGKGQQRENRGGDGKEGEGGGDISINRKQQAVKRVMVRRNGRWCDWLDWIRNSSTLQAWAPCDDEVM